MDTAFARRLIELAGEDSTNELFHAQHAGVFWVDWREADDDIVELAAAAIGRDDLVAQWNDGRLQVSFAGRTLEVPLEQKPGEQDVTLESLNRVLAPEYEVRYVKASEGGDTIAFMALPQATWRQLEIEFGTMMASAFPRLDRASPLFGGETTSKEEAIAQINAANPGVLGQLHFARAAFRLMPRADAERQRAEAVSDDTVPATRPFAGDLVVGYFRDMLAGAETIHVGELRRYAIDEDTLHSRARKYSLDNGWSKFELLTVDNVTRIVGAERLSAASFALYAPFWDRRVQSSPVRVAFVRPDVALCAPAGDADAIAIVVEMIDRTPDALSRLLYDWDGNAWQAHEITDDERRFRRLPRWQLAESGDVRAQFDIAECYRHFGLHTEAVPRYQRIAEQVLAKPVDSTDMFANGSAAMCNLADKYEHGLGVAQDLRKAHFWYGKAAALGNAVAQYDLGMMYREGRGVPQDTELATAWLSRSAKQGFRLAIEALSKTSRGAG